MIGTFSLFQALSCGRRDRRREWAARRMDRPQLTDGMRELARKTLRLVQASRVDEHIEERVEPIRSSADLARLKSVRSPDRRWS